MRLEGKVAIVTGGGKGIGAVYCKALAREGAAVLASDIDDEAARAVAREIIASGGKAISCRVDVSDPDSTQAMAAKAVETFGGIDILVNNAALFAALARKPWEQITPEDFDRVMAVNLKGVWLCCKAAVPHMRPRGKGKIINIGSASMFGAGNGLAHYLASKMGVVGLSRSLARELGDDNICVNTLMPGSTDSGTNSANTPREFLERNAQARSFKRVQVPEDLVGTLLYLASSDSDFVTGQSLLVDGGRYFH